MLKKYIFLTLAVCLLAYSCEDDRTLVVANLGDAPVIAAPANGYSVAITLENLTDQFAEISWSPADFGFTAGVDYQAQMDVAGNGFAEPVSLGPVTNGLKLAVTNQKVNTLMVAKGLPGGEFTDMEIRIVADASDKLAQLISSPITVRVSPLAVEIEYPKLGVPGSYQNWDPANETTVIFSANSNAVFEGYLFIDDAAEYKFTDGPTWDVNYGDTGADGTLEQNGDNITAAEGSGVYKLNVSLDALTYNARKTEWGLIGDATPGGWDNDTNMTYDPDTRLWRLTVDLVGGAAMKFRANDDWGINLGDTGADGKMEYDGDNIAVTDAGNYTVELDLNSAIYTYRVTKN